MVIEQGTYTEHVCEICAAGIFLTAPSCSALQNHFPEKLGQFEGDGKRRLPMRIRLMYYSDYVKADHMGMAIAALGDSDGPPFVIQDIVKNSMADRGHLEVGDELFSVDNLCCSFVADRPILVPTLTKLHQLLERLAKKQRPVEVKVFRGHGPSDRGILGYVEYVNEVYSDEVAKHGENGAPQRDVSDGGGITLVEVEKVHPVRGVQHFVPSSESVVADYQDPEMVYTTSPQVEMASTVVTAEAGVGVSRSKSSPEVVEVSNPIKAHQCGHLQPPVLAVYGISSELQPLSSALEASALASPPPSSKWAPIISSEASSSICTASSPLPSILGLTSSHLNGHPKSSLLAPPLSACGNSATQPLLEQSIDSTQELQPRLILYPRAQSPSKGFVSAQQDTAPISRSLPSQKRNFNEDMRTQKANPDYKSPPAKASISHNPLQTNTCQTLRSQEIKQALESQDDVQYDSDVSSLNEGVYFEPNPSDFNLKSDLKISGPMVVAYENNLLATSDVDNDDFSKKTQEIIPKSADSTTVMAAKEYATEPKETIEEVHSDLLPNVESEEQMCINKEHEVPKVVTKCTKTETLMAEMVTTSTLQSVQEHVDFATLSSPKQFGKLDQVTEVRMKEKDQKENPHLQANSRSLARQMIGGPFRNRLGLSPVRAPRVNVIGTWYTCAGCNQQLGTSDLMIIEQLSLFYHLSCFVCARCGIQLSDGQNETSVRIRNGLIYCYVCYHRISKSLSRSKERSERAKLKESPTRSDRHSSLARSSAKMEQFFNANSSSQSGEYIA
ncbi:unnamed protein product [Hydatigera taeniaeformis]|uniref:PDZ domain-containing protein n=1 Tax=Hydatigena taeniaeformis TaxID=6205 RepID=A0A0R3WHT5_HYDTA|nr:unnamed protein product [Hydatigera taeniaeformis]